MDSPILIKGKEDKNIISNVVLHGGWGIAVSWTISICDSIEYDTRDMEDNSKVGVSIPPSNHSYKV